MERKQFNADKSFQDKTTFFGKSEQECVTEEQNLQIEVSKLVPGKPKDCTSESSPCKKMYRSKEVSSWSESDDSEDSLNTKLQCSPPSSASYHDHSTLDVLHIEKEIDVLVKLRCLLKVDKKTKDYVGKVLTSVHCESTDDSSSKNQRQNDDSTKLAVRSDTQQQQQQMNSRLPIVSAGSCCSSSSSISPLDVLKQTECWTKEEWKNLNLLTTTMMNFANRKLHEREVDESSRRGNTDNRARERIHFTTPQVEEKYRKIVRRLTNVSEISLNDRNEATNSCIPRLSRKRKYVSEISIEPSEASLDSSTQDEIEASLGPIPPTGSNFFKGMSFILTSVSRQFIEPHQLEMMESITDAENEQQWTRRPFVRERLIAQIKAAGGVIYESFELLPAEKYATTKLITNIPNISAKSLLCLSVGIRTYNHQWIIRCCQEKKMVNPAEEQLPAGWSLTKQSYVEMYQRPSQKPFQSTLPVIVVIPMHPDKRQFVSLWKKICTNAGATVLLVKHPADDFMEGTVVLGHSLCPLWLINKAKSWDIPVVSTRWAIQCLIEGQMCSYDAHPSFDRNYLMKSPSSKF